ncbi:MAG TPA: Xaa-Pro peptidase family protein [Thermoanaerobaculia bacterium]|jgi:Xaa-Pro dipeptidase
MPLTRRRWMTAAGGAAVAAALAPPFAGAAPPAPPPLPPALSPDAFRARQARLRAAAKSSGADALFVTPSTNLAYTANLAIWRSERLTALLLFAEGPAVLLTPFFEAENHKRDAVVDDVVTWREDEDPIAIAVRLLGRGAVGIEGTTAYDTVARLGAAGSVEARDATATFEALRAIKSPEEQAFIREAARRTNLAIEATHRGLASGKTEGEISTLLASEFQAVGVRGEGLVQFGPSSALPHGGPGERRLARGDVVLIDAGCKVRGYNSDVTRTVAFGAPSDEVRKVYAAVSAAQLAGIAALRAGASGEDVDRTARKVIEDAGYGEAFTHRLGHGLGMDGHEPPYLVHGNTVPLAAGNTVTIEPGIYLPGKFGVRIEDDYAVRESSPPSSLSARPAEMVVLKP